MAGLICRLHFSSFLQNVEGWGPGPTQHCLSECKSDTQKSLVSRCWAPRIGRKQRFWLPSCPLDILLQPTYIFTLLIYIILYTSISFAESCLRSGQRYPGTVFCIFFILDLFIWGQALREKSSTGKILKMWQFAFDADEMNPARFSRLLRIASSFFDSRHKVLWSSAIYNDVCVASSLVTWSCIMRWKKVSFLECVDKARKQARREHFLQKQIHIWKASWTAEKTKTCNWTLVYRICASSEVNLGLGFLCHWSFLALFLATRRHWSWKPLTFFDAIQYYP